eukprot:2460467-Amphidinium_carterae.1
MLKSSNAHLDPKVFKEGPNSHERAKAPQKELFAHSSSKIEDQKLEVQLPKHAPQNDITSADTKPREFPRPAFVQEGYKMHLALLGLQDSSTSLRDRFTATSFARWSSFPKLVALESCKDHAYELCIWHIVGIAGSPTAVSPGRLATPYYFMDDILHKLVLWDLPEITYRQSVDGYIRELGLLYIDVVFLLFSEKYLCTDIYQKFIVQAALHGIPCFVICTQTSPDIDSRTMMKIKQQFQQLSLACETVVVVHDFTAGAHVRSTFARSKGKSSHKDYSKNASEDVLGQTVRVKDLTKKPEFNGKCGACVGFDPETQRYLVGDGMNMSYMTCHSNLEPVKFRGSRAVPQISVADQISIILELVAR